MNEASIEVLLCERLRVGDDVVARLRAAVLEHDRATRPARATPRSLILAAAGVIALVAAWWLLREGRVAPTVSAPGAMANVESTLRFRVLPTPGHDASGDESARRVGHLMNHADAIVMAKVRRVDAAEIEVQTLAIVRGSVSGELRVAPADASFGCSDATAWILGETCLLFLGRDPETLRFEPLFDGAGKVSLPWDGVFELEDIHRLEKDRTVAPERIAHWIRERGAASVHFVTSHLQELEGAKVPLHHARVQDALAETIARGAVDARTAKDFVAACMHVDAEWVRALDSEALERARASWPFVLAGVNGAFDAPLVLRPWIVLKDPWATERLREQVDAFHARWLGPGKSVGSIDLAVALYDLLFQVDPDDARARAWDLYRRLPAHGWPDAGHMLEHLLRWDPERAEREIVARASEQWEAKRGLWLDTLAYARSSAARALLREILASDALTPGVAAGFHDLSRITADRKSAAHLADVRDILLKRATKTDVAFGAWKAWFELYVRSGGDPRAASDALQSWMLADLGDEDSLALLRLLERSLGVRLLPFHRPTRADRESLRRLRGLGYVDGPVDRR